MQQILSFLLRNQNTLLFLILFSIGFGFTVESHSYHKSKWISSTNFLSGSIFGVGNSVGSYFDLKETNDVLVEENLRLRDELERYRNTTSQNTTIDSTSFTSPYRFYDAKVISNNYSKKNNYLLINRGSKDSIKPDMGVISSKGLIGIVEESTTNYSRIISILNSNLEINVGLKKSNHFGTLNWNGESPYFIQLTDVGRLAPIKVGDTIITSGNSNIFPKGILVGTIKTFNIDQSKSYYTIDIELFNDMTNLGPVYIIENMAKDDIESLIDTDNTNE